MLFFKKNPAAVRKDGLTHLFAVFTICILTFIPAFGLAPIFANVGLGTVFFESETNVNLFNEFYLRMYNETGYFEFLYSPLIMLLDGNARGYLRLYGFIPFLTLGFSILILYSYYRLIFINRFCTFLIHPKSIRKSFISHFFQNITFKNTIKLSFALLFIMIIINEFSFFYYDLWAALLKPDDPYASSSGLFMIIPAYILDVTAKFVIPYFIVWLSVASIITWQIIRENKQYRKLASLGRATARWGGVGSYITHDFNYLIKKNKKEFYKFTTQINPIYLGTTTFTSDPKIGGRHFGLDTDTHMLTIAQTGAGKSRDVLHTNLAIWKNGLFVLDPKGEHAQRTYELRKKAGFPVYILDPYGLCSHIKETDSINILEEINPSSPSAADDIQTISYACIPPDDKETGNAKHFRETAQMLFAGLVAHVLTTFPKEEQNLTTVFDIFLSGKPDGTLINQNAFYEILGDMAGNPACGKLPMQAVSMLLRAPPGERGSIYSTFMRSVSWTQSPAIKKVLSKSTVKLDDIRSKDATIYLVLPFGYMRPQARWIRSIIGLAFKRSEFPSTLLRDRHEKKKSLFILDEFLQLENCKAVQDAFTTLRGAGVKLWLLSQSLADIKEFYSNHKSMVGACDKQFFGTDDLEDTEYIEQFLGEYEKIITEGNKNEPRTQREINKLSTAFAIRETIEKSEAGEGYQIVKPTAGLPVVLNLVPCYWLINKERYGDFKQTILPEYSELESVGDSNQENDTLDRQAVINQLKGLGSQPQRPAPTGGIPSRGEKSPLRRDIDNLKEELEELKKRVL